MKKKHLPESVLHHIISYPLIVLVCLCLSNLSIANVRTYPFRSAEHEQRAYQLLKVIRCPQCQNQNLLESNARLAEDLIREVSARVNRDESNEEILEALQIRYGKAISYNPPFEQSTLILWLGPFFVLLIGSGFMYVIYRPRSS